MPFVLYYHRVFHTDKSDRILVILQKETDHFHSFTKITLQFFYQLVMISPSFTQNTVHLHLPVCLIILKYICIGNGLS